MESQPLLQYDVAYPDRLSRGLIFIKWLLVIPHLVVLYFLQLAMRITSVVAFFAILFSAKYPRGLWDFGLMVLGWQARVYAYVLLQRDEYPPFGDSDYPVLFHLDYPARLSRWKIFVKWILVIPHAICLAVLGVAASFVMVVAWFAILFTGRFPRGMFEFINGVNRWSNRVLTYAMLMTDAYPPFSMGEPPAATSLVGGYQQIQPPAANW